jgi:hypothetical protein
VVGLWNGSNPSVAAGLSPVAIKKFVLSQYRQFEMFEHVLHRPQYAATLFLFPIPERIKLRMVELYANVYPHKLS